MNRDQIIIISKVHSLLTSKFYLMSFFCSGSRQDIQITCHHVSSDSFLTVSFLRLTWFLITSIPLRSISQVVCRIVPCNGLDDILTKFMYWSLTLTFNCDCDLRGGDDKGKWSHIVPNQTGLTPHRKGKTQQSSLHCVRTQPGAPSASQEEPAQKLAMQAPWSSDSQPPA